ncbi:MAG TPA: hypothetical protein VFY37_02965 [Solirubrobacterales bacterium]|nr:hypothetical protein [Solirubrobacterales bacterium]
MTAFVPYEPDRLLEVFERHGVRYVVIGGFAAMLRGSPYDTTDVDVTPERSELNLRRLSAALEELEAAVRVDAESAADLPALEQDPAALDRFQTLALTTKHGNLDICLVPDGTQGYRDLRRGATRELITETLEIPVASLADVIRSKEATGREKDLLHLPTLRRLLERAKLGD